MNNTYMNISYIFKNFIAIFSNKNIKGDFKEEKN